MSLFKKKTTGVVDFQPLASSLTGLQGGSSAPDLVYIGDPAFLPAGGT